MSDTVKIKLSINTGFIGGKHETIEEVDAGEWEEMSEKAKEALLDQMAQDFLQERIEVSAFVVED